MKNGFLGTIALLLTSIGPAAAQPAFFPGRLNSESVKDEGATFGIWNAGGAVINFRDPPLPPDVVLGGHGDLLSRKPGTDKTNPGWPTIDGLERFGVQSTSETVDCDAPQVMGYHGWFSKELNQTRKGPAD